MGEQQSQKRGLASESQKEQRARDAYAPIPPSNAVAGAFGNPEPAGFTDQEQAMTLDEKRRGQQDAETSQ
jgi:hypothetical protein